MNVFVVIDGLGDLAVPELKHKTPLEAAHTPHLDWFAAHGKNGYVYAVREGIAPESDSAIVALLGNDVEQVYTGRGPLEALGADIPFKTGDIALRTNFATIDGDRVIDRRVGRGLTTREAKILEKEINGKVKLTYPFDYRSTVQHRGVLVVHGDFSDKISNIDPAYKRIGKLSVAAPHGSSLLESCVPLDKSIRTRKSVQVINAFFEQVCKILEKSDINNKRKKEELLPANASLLRDAGIGLPRVANLSGWGAVVSMPLEIGVARHCGMNVFSFCYPEMRSFDIYKNLYAGLKKTIRESKRALRDKRMRSYYIHFKEVDVCGHDGNYKEKVKMLELIDKEFFGFLRRIEVDGLRLIVTGDHSTPCTQKAHSDDPVPLLFYGEGSDGVRQFGERACKKGSLGKLYGKDVLRIGGF